MACAPSTCARSWWEPAHRSDRVARRSGAVSSLTLVNDQLNRQALPKPSPQAAIDEIITAAIVRARHVPAALHRELIAGIVSPLRRGNAAAVGVAEQRALALCGTARHCESRTDRHEGKNSLAHFFLRSRP